MVPILSAVAHFFSDFTYVVKHMCFRGPSWSLVMELNQLFPLQVISNVKEFLTDGGKNVTLRPRDLYQKISVMCEKQV